MRVDLNKSYAPTEAHAEDGTYLGVFASPFLAKAREEEVAIQVAKTLRDDSEGAARNFMATPDTLI